MSEQTIYYKRNDTDLSPLFLAVTGNRAIQVNIYEEFEEYSITSCTVSYENLEWVLVCPAYEFKQAFAKAMLKCEAMHLFSILGLDMSPKLNAQIIQKTTDVKMSTAQNCLQVY